MYRILIVDDEPLARIGIQSMLSSFNSLEILPSAPNGQAALEIIQNQHPDIVICDIKMPIMNGLQLLEEVYHNVEPKPVFIMLTSYEDFEYVRTSIKYEACYYLMKMELNDNTLTDALEKAYARLDARKIQLTTTENRNENIFLNRFYFNLLNYTFNSEEDIKNTAEYFSLNLSAPCYITLAVHLDFDIADKPKHAQSYKTYTAVTTTIKDCLLPYFQCHFAAWNQDTIGIILLINETPIDSGSFKELLLHCAEMTLQYFNCNLYFGIGKKVTQLLSLSDSFACALSALTEASVRKNKQQIFYYKCVNNTPQAELQSKDFMSIQELNRLLIRALESCDCDLFQDTFNRLLPLITQWKSYTSISYISAIIHIIINCLDDGEAILNDAFENQQFSYRSIYTCHTPDKIRDYINILRNCIMVKMNSMKVDSKYKLVLTAQNYIRDHIYDKVTLNETAAFIGVSPNYLSTLFGTYSDLGFSDYVINLKIQKAREILSHSNKKVYEVSQMLGFENSHYFSKVYKKFTGFSPTETPYIG